MNEIKVLINFEKRTNVITGVDLTSGDYNSTKIIFEFDRNDGTKIFELKNPKNEVVFSKEIINNEIILANIDENGVFSSIFNIAGEYTFEVSLYANEGKLTSDYNYLNVEKEQVVIGDEIVEPYLPIFDDLMQKINTAITETNNLDIDIQDNIVTITKKDGTIKSENVKGDKGEKGEPGVIKMLFFASKEDLPETGSGDTLYFVKIENQTETNYYQEYAWVNKGTEENPHWDYEDLGGAVLNVDLTDYVKNTDFAGVNKHGIVKFENSFGITADNNGRPFINRATNAEIDAKKSTYKPIVPVNLDYAVGSVKASETQSGSAKMWTSTNEDGEIGLNISTEV